jgi:hypothetical protein
METDSLLTVIFIAIVGSYALNRIYFYDYFNANRLNTKPILTNRNLFITEVVNIYLNTSTLSLAQRSSLNKLKWWELTNFMLLPLLLLFVLLQVIFS